jgi:hypothetical protein
MPRHSGLPRLPRTQISRAALLATLEGIDADASARARVLSLETGFRRKVDDHVASLPSASSAFEEFNTSPFVLLIHARQRQYSKVSESRAGHSSCQAILFDGNLRRPNG